MYRQDNWSVSINPWGRLDVRLHVAFLLFGVGVLYAAWVAAGAGENSQYLSLAISGVAILFVSVLFHEWSHFQAAEWFGGYTDRIILMPYGGHEHAEMPRDPQAELIVLLSGPLANICLCLMSISVLFSLSTADGLGSLLHPLAPLNVFDDPTPATQITKLVFWVNWNLTLLNLLPFYPFDGGRMVQVATTVFWKTMRREEAATSTAQLSKIASLGLLLLGLILVITSQADDLHWIVPPWLAFATLSMCIFFNARNVEVTPEEEEEIDDDFFGYDFSQGYTSLERSVERTETKSSQTASWLEQRQLERLEQQRELELQEEQRMDDVLEQLHSHGIDSLSADDRSLLDRVSERLRKRLVGDE